MGLMQNHFQKRAKKVRLADKATKIIRDRNIRERKIRKLMSDYGMSESEARWYVQTGRY